MPKRASALADAFLEDHRHLTRGLTRLLEAIREEKFELAVRLAEELDRVVGPHMQFEEEVFYPMLAERLGRGFAGRLYGEHALGQRAVRKIKALRPEQIDSALQQELIVSLSKTLDHALSCGSLLSYVSHLQPGEEERLVKRLRELRSTGKRWTELASEKSETQQD